MPRVPLADHQADVAALLAPLLSSSTVPLDHRALGRVCAEDVRAAVDVPSADNSQMDGFALRAEDADALVVGLAVGEPIAAGDAPSALAAAEARPIMTGAPVPEGTDRIIPVEDTADGRFDVPTVRLRDEAAVGESGRFIRRRGSDTRAGDTVLRAGQRLTPARIAHLASTGVRGVRVLDPVRTAVLSTGTEVTDPSQPLPPGAAYDANGPGLAAALADAGAEIVRVGRVPDDPQALHALLAELVADDVRLLVTSGGVSAGAYEVVKQAAGLPGIDLTFCSVAMQPGGPQGIGSATVGDHRIAWLAFPGNPVSALVSCELFARPALGAEARARLRLPVRLDVPEASPATLAQLRRAWILPSGELRLAGGPSSHLLGALAGADALAIVPVGVDRVDDGDLLEASRLG